MFETVLWIALGGAIGTLCRFGLAEAFAAWLGTDFPWGTVIVNVTGCFVVGFFGTLTGPDGRVVVSAITRQAAIIGLLRRVYDLLHLQLRRSAMMRKSVVDAGRMAHAGSCCE